MANKQIQTDSTVKRPNSTFSGCHQSTTYIHLDLFMGRPLQQRYDVLVLTSCSAAGGLTTSKFWKAHFSSTNSYMGSWQRYWHKIYRWWNFCCRVTAGKWLRCGLHSRWWRVSRSVCLSWSRRQRGRGLPPLSQAWSPRGAAAGLDLLCHSGLQRQV